MRLQLTKNSILLQSVWLDQASSGWLVGDDKFLLARFRIFHAEGEPC